MLWIVGFGRVPSRTYEGNSRQSSESVSGVFLEFCRNFFRKVATVLGAGAWPGGLAKCSKSRDLA